MYFIGGITGRPNAARNPLDRLKPNSPDLGEDTAALAEALFIDPLGLILFAACHEEPGHRTLASVREYLTLPPDRLK